MPGGLDSFVHINGRDQDIGNKWRQFWVSSLTVIEIEWYATWSGQACAYKIGEIKIKRVK